ncbi:hypothetical protein SLS57_008190 [Botryosphaeria dothidea]
MSNFLRLVLLNLLFLASASFARAPLSYVAEPADLYSPAKPDDIVTILDLIRSRSDTSKLAQVIEKPAGFAKAFDTYPSWNFTFFAPSDEAFNNTGSYFETYLRTPKGIWWIGNVINHHYIPNTALEKGDFNSTLSRIQGVVHIIDRILDPSAQIFEKDLPKVDQKFIAGSCSNPELPYC